MKWFQHLSDSHTNPKVRQILRKYGLEGLGLWWLCCELVAKDGIDYRLKSKTEWKITLLDISRIEQKKADEMLNFFSDINSIDKKALNRGDLHIPKMADYSDDYTKKVRRVSGHSTESVRQDNNTIDNTTLDKNTTEKNDLIIKLKNWNECQSSPLVTFRPENIINKHGVEKVGNLLKRYGPQNNGFSLFLGDLKN